MIRGSLLKTLARFCLVVVGVWTCSAETKTRVQRSITAIAATDSGSELLTVIDDDGSGASSVVQAFSMPGGKTLWHREGLPNVQAAAFTDDSKILALGLDRTPNQPAVCLIMDAFSGKVVHDIQQEDSMDFFPSGVKALAFTPDKSLLYGLTDSSLFAWDTQGSKLLWTKEVPGGLPRTQLDTANSFALSADGTRLGMNRFGRVFLLNVGRVEPRTATELPGSIGNVGDQPAFSPDGRYFVTGYGYNSSFSGALEHYPRGGLLWPLGSKPVPVNDCGGHFAWTANPEVFACQNGTGIHLRSVRDPSKDVGAAGPVSDLPLLRVGNSLWAAAYRVTDWKDPAKALPLTLVELGTGKRITVTLPGRQ